MTINECLKGLFEEEMQQVFLCSADWLMSRPKKGMEDDWETHRQRAEILQSLLEGKGEGQ